MTARSFTTPIALSHTHSATITLPWFVQHTEYNPAQATFKPLVNGEEAFGAVYDAIVAAKHSVDIICWGFQPSMYFKRGSAIGIPIGELLARKGAEGVKIRLLCWGDGTHLAQGIENMAPGDNIASYIKHENRNETQRDFDREWYRRANLSNATKSSTAQKMRAVTSPIGATTAVYDAADQFIHRHDAFPNFEFATRDFALNERAEIAYRTWMQSQDPLRSTGTKAGNSAMMGTFPTHHQKMVLIDYEHPELALGFVMGHNMLDAYWDQDQHPYARMHPAMGRNGFYPRQDISSRVSGPILRHLNENFCQAWDDATGQTLGQSRAGVANQLKLRRNGDTPVMAQILRTQSQHGDGGIKDIESMYLQAVNNTTNFIYIENQYFRFPPLAEKIKELVKSYQQGGRDTPIYLFVVTNSNNDGMGTATVNTYRMLNSLGRADAMPQVAKLEQGAALQSQYDEAAQQARQAGQQATALSDNSPSAIMSAMGAAQTQQEALARQAELKVEMDKLKTQPIVPTEIPGLKVHICTLVAPDSPPGNAWEYVYVHAKLMIVDDVFTTLGSANINLRSMEADSELNICHECMDVTQPLRERLWGIHTKGKGVGKKDGYRLDGDAAFKAWSMIIKENDDRQKDRNRPSPYASLIKFRYDGTKRTNWD